MYTFLGQYSFGGWQKYIYTAPQDVKHSIVKIVNDTVTAIYDVRGEVGWGKLSLCKGRKCLTISLLCTPEIKKGKK